MELIMELKQSNGYVGYFPIKEVSDPTAYLHTIMH